MFPKFMYASLPPRQKVQEGVSDLVEVGANVTGEVLNLGGKVLGKVLDKVSRKTKFTKKWFC